MGKDLYVLVWPADWSVMDDQVTATELSILYTLQGERGPLPIGAIADRANARDHHVVTLLGRLCREDLAQRMPVHDADWPPAGMYRLTGAGRRWVLRVLAANSQAIFEESAEPAGDEPPSARFQPEVLSAAMRRTLCAAGDDGRIVGRSQATEDALIRRGLAEPLAQSRYNPHTGEMVAHRIGVRLNGDGMARRAELLPHGVDAHTSQR